VPGKTPREAVKAYLQALQNNVSIACKGVLRVSNYDRLDEISVLTLMAPVPLNRRSDLYLSFKQQYKVVTHAEKGRFRVTTLYYSYAVETQDGQEIVGYHWHPDGVSPIAFPHLHLGAASRIGMKELSNKAHFPTGRVAFEDVVQFLIATFGVEPDRTRLREVAGKTRSRFARHKTW
jgi:hypothetical protein